MNFILNFVIRIAKPRRNAFSDCNGLATDTVFALYKYIKDIKSICRALKNYSFHFEFTQYSGNLCYIIKILYLLHLDLYLKIMYPLKLFVLDNCETTKKRVPLL